MSELTRRVLDAHQTITDAPACDWNEIDRARDTLENAAPSSPDRLKSSSSWQTN